jgi:hypothetical protein
VRAEERARHSGEHALALFAQARLVLEQLRSSTAQMCFEALDGRRNVWVLKPSYGSKGMGVRLLNGDEGLSAVLGERDSRRVVQKYVERPLLIGGYKFDIRCWVLVTEWSPQLRAWFYDDDVLLRLLHAGGCRAAAGPRQPSARRRAANTRDSAVGGRRGRRSARSAVCALGGLRGQPPGMKGRIERRSSSLKVRPTPTNQSMP